jgi:xanthine dehydrogenase iron-sulfur cluster and FAD-binding subunit A
LGKVLGNPETERERKKLSKNERNLKKALDGKSSLCTFRRPSIVKSPPRKATRSKSNEDVLPKDRVPSAPVRKANFRSLKSLLCDCTGYRIVNNKNLIRPVNQVVK